MSVRPWIPNRSSKRVEAPPAEEITVATEVPPPNEIPEVVPPNKFQKLLPLLMGVAIIGMIGIFLSMGIRRMSPMMLMFPLMFLMAAGGMMAGHGNSGGPKTPEIDLNRRKYLEMLTGLRRKVHSRAAAQYRYLAHYAPSPDTLAALVSSPRQWERSAPDRDPTYFLAPRVGVAPQKLGGTANSRQRVFDLMRKDLRSAQHGFVHAAGILAHAFDIGVMQRDELPARLIDHRRNRQVQPPCPLTHDRTVDIAGGNRCIAIGDPFD